MTWDMRDWLWIGLFRLICRTVDKVKKPLFWSKSFLFCYNTISPKIISSHNISNSIISTDINEIDYRFHYRCNLWFWSTNDGCCYQFMPTTIYHLCYIFCAQLLLDLMVFREQALRLILDLSSTVITLLVSLNIVASLQCELLCCYKVLKTGLYI